MRCEMFVSSSTSPNVNKVDPYPMVIIAISGKKDRKTAANSIETATKLTNKKHHRKKKLNIFRSANPTNR